MNFIKKIRDKNFDNSVHMQFQKFSKGEFRNRAGIQVKKSGKKYTIFTGPEFANEFVEDVAKELGKKQTLVRGAIITTLDINIEFKDKKQFQGVKKYVLEKQMSGEEILSLLKEYPKAFFGLSFESDKSKLKIKAKAPKSGKPGKGDVKTKPDFCKLITEDFEIGSSFIFETPNFKTANVEHTYFIDDIIKPKNETDYSRIRELATRKGRIKRVAEIDEKTYNSELEFEA